MRFIHTSDLQIGKVFLFANPETQALLQEARQRTVLLRLGQLAVEHEAGAVLVAGDVYDKQQLLDLTLDKPLETMRGFPQVDFHLMPGNHDHYVEGGLWDRLRRKLPPNVFVHLEAGPVAIGRNEAVPTYLLPAPLQLRSSVDDLSEYMDAAPTPEGAIRIGMAHGTITGFEAEGEARNNYVSPLRPKSAGLAYLAMGDWHRLQRINERVFYSGTPEPDQFKLPPPDAGTGTRCNGGKALLVDVAGPRAVPDVTELVTGQYEWHSISETLGERAAVDRLESTVRALAPDLGRLLVELRVQGTLTLADRRWFEERIGQSLRAALALLRLDDSRVVLQPSAADLDEIDRSGFVRAAADSLRAINTDDPDPKRRRIAELALHRLYLEHLKLGA